MTLHRIIVLSMLAVVTVLALLYVSTFPVDGADDARLLPAVQLEPEKPATSPGGVTPVQIRYDAETLRSLA